MQHTFVRRAAATVAASTLGLAVLATTSPAEAAPVAGPTSAVTGWTTGQLTGGLFFNQQYSFNDVGLSIDAGLGLRALGETAGADKVADAVALPANINGYIGEGTESYGGAIAKAAVFAQASGRPATSFGGVNLVARLQARVDDTTGRLSDASSFGDSANVVGQTYAAQALDAAGSSEAADARTFLLQQQCAAGYFRLNFSAVGSSTQGCTTDAADTDTTAFAVRALLAQDDDPTVAAALTRATNWLLSQQAADGSFGGSGPTAAANANSTGLAGAALGDTNHPAAAARAAAWVRGLQVAEFTPCPSTKLSAQNGAIAYDAAALAAGRTNGITTLTSDQWRRTTSQAMAVLKYESPTTAPTISGPTGFVKAGTKIRLQVTGLSAGEAACVNGVAGKGAALVGTGANLSPVVELPKGGGTKLLALKTLDQRATTKVRTLGTKTLGLVLKKDKVVKGFRQVAKVSGLAQGESVKVFFRGEKIAEGTANAKGKLTARFKVDGKIGFAKVRVKGEYKFRKNDAPFRVAR